MKCNVGGIDRYIRLMLGAVLILSGFVPSLGTDTQVALTVLGSIALLTALVQFCPVNMLLGVDTSDDKPADNREIFLSPPPSRKPRRRV